MKLTNRAVVMTATLSLNEREIDMLRWLVGYGAETIAEAIAVKLPSQFSKNEWEILWRDLRSELESTNSHFVNVRQVFTGQKRAAPPVSEEPPKEAK